MPGEVPAVMDNYIHLRTIEEVAVDALRSIGGKSQFPLEAVVEGRERSRFSEK